ncbi:hypothetical protein KSP40_PGU022716 [Platanthera guangdongensis]|uniref:Uncharacterized protein n=1 Tax=Platanthera guangdongensis TaxID=2320717 RepID=A0ABR2LX14_9ASPA
MGTAEMIQKLVNNYTVHVNVCGGSTGPAGDTHQRVTTVRLMDNIIVERQRVL